MWLFVSGILHLTERLQGSPVSLHPRAISGLPGVGTIDVWGWIILCFVALCFVL